MASRKRRRSSKDFDRTQAGELSTINGPVQMAIVVPMIPTEEYAKVAVAPLSVELRDAMEKVLFENGLMYRGIGVKIMKERIPQSMQDELVYMRDHKEEYSQTTKTGAFTRVRRGWEALWNEPE